MPEAPSGSLAVVLVAQGPMQSMLKAVLAVAAARFHLSQQSASPPEQPSTSILERLVPPEPMGLPIRGRAVATLGSTRPQILPLHLQQTVRLPKVARLIPGAVTLAVLAALLLQALARQSILAVMVAQERLVPL
jgi:hypothetical protein